MKNPLSLQNRIWAAGILNIIALLFQIANLIQTRNSTGISLVTFLIFIFLNATLAQAGYKNKDWGQFWCMLIATLLMAAIFIMAWFFKP